MKFMFKESEKTEGVKRMSEHFPTWKCYKQFRKQFNDALLIVSIPTLVKYYLEMKFVHPIVVVALNVIGIASLTVRLLDVRAVFSKSDFNRSPTT